MFSMLAARAATVDGQPVRYAARACGQWPRRIGGVACMRFQPAALAAANPHPLSYGRRRAADRRRPCGRDRGIRMPLMQEQLTRQQLSSPCVVLASACCSCNFHCVACLGAWHMLSSRRVLSSCRMDMSRPCASSAALLINAYHAAWRASGSHAGRALQQSNCVLRRHKPAAHWQPVYLQWTSGKSASVEAHFVPRPHAIMTRSLVQIALVV